MREHRKWGTETEEGMACIPHPGKQNPTGKITRNLSQDCSKPVRLGWNLPLLNACMSITTQSTHSDTLLIFDWSHWQVHLVVLCREWWKGLGLIWLCFGTESVNQYIQKVSFKVQVEMCFLKFSSNPLSANISDGKVWSHKHYGKQTPNSCKPNKSISNPGRTFAEFNRNHYPQLPRKRHLSSSCWMCVIWCN